MAIQTHTIKTNCMFCGKEFDSSDMSKVCDVCDMRMEEYFTHIKEYLDEYPDRTALEINMDLDIPLKVIEYFIKEQRLIAKNPGSTSSGVKIKRCPKCNKLMPAGKNCIKCDIAALHKRIKNTYTVADGSPTEKPAVKFHLSKR